MHDTVTLGSVDTRAKPGLVAKVAGRAKTWIIHHRYLMYFVVFPTLLVAAYLYLVASDQYETEAHFVVRASNAPQVSPTGLGQALSLVGGAGPADRDGALVADYLTSHDAVEALQKRLDLVAMFRRPEVDPFSRLWSANPAPETLASFYNSKVSVKAVTDTGIDVLKVRAFRPADAMRIIQELLTLSEQRVNALNQRNFSSAVAISRRQMTDAAREVSQVQAAMTSFRQGQRDFNPQSTGQARTQLVSQLQGRLADARAQESAMAAALSPSSPQLVALRERVSALEQQAAAERAQLSSGPGNVATGLGSYERLQLRQQMASKQYEAAASGLQRAQDDATKQQLFITRVVDPNMPGKSLYPKRLKIVGTVLLALLLAYGISWLIVAGVREHAA